MSGACAGCSDPFCECQEAPDAYAEFLARKLATTPPTGIENPDVRITALMPWQRDLVVWALRRGRAALFCGTGTGKTVEQLAYGDSAYISTGRDVLIFAPLGVTVQTVAEGERFGVSVTLCKEMHDVRPGLNITNYERADRFDPSRFGAVILDESGRLKGLDSKTRTGMTERFAATPFRLCCTATPAPNDHTELGQHAEFLGVCTRAEMLATYFTRDGGSTQDWRLKGHAEALFWRWVCEWAIVVRMPSDLGYPDDGFVLPPLTTHEHVTDAAEFDARAAGTLFALPARSLNEQRSAKRGSMSARVARTAAIIASEPSEQWVCWCELNDEQDALEEALGDAAVSIRGATEPDEKLRLHERWMRGEVRTLITKGALFGWGLNWQHCARQIFVGVTHSFEMFFQCVRRSWRFRQLRPVDIHVVTGPAESEILASLKRKERDAERMAISMAAAMRETQLANVRGFKRSMIAYEPGMTMQLPPWMQGVNGVTR